MSVHEITVPRSLMGMNDVESRDTRVVHRALAGDRDAFAMMVEAQWPPMVRLARSIVGDADAEDAVQDGMVTAWQRLRSLRDPERWTAWLGRIVVRTCLRRARKQRPWLPLSAAADRAMAYDPDGTLDMQRLLQLLAPRQRAVMHLTVVEGMSDREIGQRMRITAGSVRAHRRRARQRIQRVLSGGRAR